MARRAEQPAGPPICALTLPQQIADHLGHRIMNGDYRPGSRLKEEEFAEAYAVSRGPVREAFRILERRGFVEIVPRHGARVRAFDPADLASLFSVRAVLFGLAARQATERRSSGADKPARRTGRAPAAAPPRRWTSARASMPCSPARPST